MKKITLVFLLILASCALISPPIFIDGVEVSTTQELVDAVANCEPKIYVRDVAIYTPTDLTIDCPMEIVNYPAEHPTIKGSGYRGGFLIRHSDVLISGITIDASNGQHEAIKVTIVAGQETDNVSLKNLTIHDSPSHGILVTHVGRVEIENCTITNTGTKSAGELGYEPHGVYCNDVDQCILIGNTILPNRGYSIHVYSGSDDQLTYIEGNTAVDIGVFYGQTVITNNIFRALALRYGIRIARVYHNEMIYTGGFSGVYIHNVQNAASFFIRNNHIEGVINGVYARDPYSNNPMIEVDHNEFIGVTNMINTGFTLNVHDNYTQTGQPGVWLLPLDFNGRIRNDPPTIGAVE